MTERKASPKRSALEESPLADMVQDVSETGASMTDDEQERERMIGLYMREQGVPRNVAIIMANTGYSKGTAYRIINDQFKKRTAERERVAGLNA